MPAQKCGQGGAICQQQPNLIIDLQEAGIVQYHRTTETGMGEEQVAFGAVFAKTHPGFQGNSGASTEGGIVFDAHRSEGRARL